MDELERWAASGAMWLTGRPDGPPQVGPGAPASAVAAALERVREFAPELAIPPGAGLLGERAAYAGLTRNAPRSCGGAARILPTPEGELVLSLPRPSDLDLVPALVESELPSSADPWTMVTDWAAGVPASQAEERLRLLGLAGGVVGGGQPSPERVGGVHIRELSRRTPRAAPLVVDLTSLWAGPLCAHLLGLGGAQVVKVESRTRPDGARLGAPGFFDLLHEGHRELVLDFTTELGVLRELISQADLVLEASRPRALRQLGIDAEQVVRDGTSWLSITARGRSEESIGFGDDVAACAGLVAASDSGESLFVGDALADPLTGVTAAAAGAAALTSTHAQLIDVSMLHVATCAAAGGPAPPHSVTRDAAGTWWLEGEAGRYPIAPPARRP
jgi:hypothetical protein